MEYASNKLCHFIGRSLPSDDDRFLLLIKVMKGKKLITNLKEPSKTEIVISSKYEGDRVGEIFEKSDCVCFCDIPDNALYIHTKKYGKFGLGFKKQYLAEKGAHPVMYIPMNYDIKEISETDLPKKPTEYFNELSKEYSTILCFCTLINKISPFSELLEKICLTDLAPFINNIMNPEVTNLIRNGKSHQLLFAQMMAFTGILSYIKLFDTTLSPDDENNYYMEREWRILNSVEFSLNDIQTIYLPNNEYIEPLKKELPDYKGDFYILNN